MKQFTMLLAGLLLMAVPVVAQYGVCDQISAYWQADLDELHFNHTWEDNCAVDQISYSMAVDGFVITVDEWVSSFALATCMCPFYGEPMLGGLAPGDYTVVWNYHFECREDPEWVWDETCDEFTVIVPASAQGEGFENRGYNVSGCGIGDITSVPSSTPGTDARTWAAVKGIFD